MESADVQQIVQRSREQQGLPPTIGDPGTLARIAELIALASSTRTDTAQKTAGARLAPEEPPRGTRATCKGVEGWDRMAKVLPDQGAGAMAALDISITGTSDGDAGSLVALTGADDPSGVAADQRR